MAQFSGTVKIGDLNDFIAPSQACVVSLQGAQAPDAKPPARLLEEEGKVQLNAPRAAPAPGGFKQTYTPGGGTEGPVKVSLNDCLACSGCVTSAETVLLEAQSTGELASKLTEPGAVVVVSVSPQSRASLAVLHGLSADDVQARLTTALRRLGAAAVFDIGVAREMALAEAAEEFMQRYRHARSPSSAAPAAAHPGAPTPGPLPMLASACPGWVCYAEKTQAGSLLPHISTTKSPQAVMGTLVKRALAQRRGWDPARIYHATVMPCYDKKLEAARDDFYLPGTFVPEVDSSLTTGELQQLLDALGAGQLTEVEPTPLDSLLPEAPAAAGAFHSHHQNSSSSGSVNGSGSGWEAAYPWPKAPGSEPRLHGAIGSSGGYLEAVARSAAATLLGPAATPPDGAPLPSKPGRNPDLREVLLPAPEAAAASSGCPAPQPPVGHPLRFAAAYGFRNIQSLVRKIKLGRCDYDYVEVMACPGGCLNGGGQAKPRPGVSAAALLDELEQAYLGESSGSSGGGENGGGGCCGNSNDGGCENRGNGACSHGGGQENEPCAMDVDGAATAVGGGAATALTQPWRPPLSATARALYREFVGGAPGSPAAQALLHTEYHHRAKTAMGTVGDW